MKSNVIELAIPEELTEGGRYSPRFIDEISDELDVIEDKKAPFLGELVVHGGRKSIKFNFAFFTHS